MRWPKSCMLGEPTVPTKVDRRTDRTTLSGYALAVLFVAGALLLTVWIEQISARAYFILFVPAVMFASVMPFRRFD